LGGYDEAAVLCAQAVAELDLTGDPTAQALAREQLAQLLWLTDDEDGALALDNQAAALVEDQPPSPGKAAVIAAHARCLMLSDRDQEAILRSRAAIDLAVTTGDRASEAAATITLGASLIAGAGRLEEGVEVLLRGLAIARQIDDLDQLERAVFNLSWPLVQLGRAGQAIDLLLEVINAAAERGRVDTVAFLRIDLAYELTGAGRLDEAETALHAIDPPEVGTNLILYRVAESALALARGDLSTAIAHIEAALSESSKSSSPHTRGTLVHAAVVVALAGDIPLARERIDSARRQISEREGAATQADVAAVAVVIESLAARHDPRATLPATRASSLLEEMRAAFETARSGGLLTPGQHAASSLAEAEGASILGRPDVRLWAGAAEARDRYGSVLLGGYARLRQAETLIAAGGSRDEAARLTSQVRDLAERSGALWLARMANQLATRARLVLARAQPQTARVHPTELYGLTPRECEVLDHLVAGHTNRQIATDLFISEKTAGVHVSNLMRKLGVPNRIAAAGIGQRLGLGPN
jgi:DNA-binding CsgD family transcriptional regulator